MNESFGRYIEWITKAGDKVNAGSNIAHLQTQLTHN